MQELGLGSGCTANKRGSSASELNPLHPPATPTRAGMAMAHGVTAQEWGPCLCEGRQVTLRDPKPFRVTPNHPQLGLIHPPSLGKARVRTGNGSLDQQHPGACQQETFAAGGRWVGITGQNSSPSRREVSQPWPLGSHPREKRPGLLGAVLTRC